MLVETMKFLTCAAGVVLLSLVLNCGLAEERRTKGSICTNDCTWIYNHWKKEKAPLQPDDPPHPFCYHGVDKLSPNGVLHIWHALSVQIDSRPSNGITVTTGNTSEAVKDPNAEVYHGFFNGSNEVHLSPYGTSCISVRHSGDVGSTVYYRLTAKEKLLWWLPVLLVVGILVFFSAPSLSRNVTLYYGTGITIGVLASILVLLYVFSKFVPKKNLLGLGILLTGYTVFASFAYWFLNYALEIVVNNWQYVLAYILVAGLISFGVLYRVGPVENPRTLDLIQWTIQLVALGLIFCSSQLPEVAAAFVAMTLVSYWIPLRYNPLRWLVYCLLFPFHCVCRALSCLNPFNWFRTHPRPRLLTLEEYEEQGRVETEKAVQELREYARTHDLWNTISNLHSSKRFTEFLSGKNHVSSQEQVQHEWSFVVEDSSESDTVDYDEEEVTPTVRRSFASSSNSSFQSSCDESPHVTPSPSPPHSRDRERPHYRSPYRSRPGETSTPRHSASSSSSRIRTTHYRH